MAVTTNGTISGYDFDSSQVEALQALVAGDGNGNIVSVSVRWVAGDMSAAIQGAIDAIWTVSQYGGEVVLIDCNIYEAQGLVLKPRVNLRGVGVTFSELHSLQADAPQALRGPVLRLVSGATQPLISNFLPTSASTKNGYQRSTSNVLNAPPGNAEVNGSGAVVSEGSPLSQWYQSSTIEGITFDGAAQNQTVACALLYFERCWSVVVKNCNIINSNYFGIALIDCNSFQIDSVWSHYAPWFLFDTADTQIRNCTIAGSLYYAHALWLHGNQCWLNQLANNLIYNSSLNNEAQWTNPSDTVTARIRRSSEGVTGTDGVTATQFAITSHKLYDDMPVTLSSTGSLPTGFYANRTYWVRRINGNSIALAENLNRRRAGVLVAATSAGSGTISIDRGYSANCVFSGGAQINQIVGGRFDQAYGDGVLLIGAPKNSITCNVSQAGLGSTDPKAGIRLRSGYTETQPATLNLIGASDNVIAGIVLGAAGGNQTQGIVCDDAASEAGINTYGTNVSGHSTSNFTPPHIGSRRRLLRHSNNPLTRTAVGSAADQTQTAVLSFTVPGRVGGSLGKNGRLILNLRFNAPLAATRNAEVQVWLGVQQLTGAVALTNVSYEMAMYSVYANNSTGSLKIVSSQVLMNTFSGVAPSVLTINMTQDQTFEVRVRWPSVPTAGDTVSLESHSIELIESD